MTNSPPCPLPTLRQLWRKAGPRVKTVAVGIVIALGLAWLLVPSPSPSLPSGLYIRALPLHRLRVGDIVSLETPEALYATLPAWAIRLGAKRRLLKQVGGLAGTVVCWNATGMVVHLPGLMVQYLYLPNPPLVPQREGCQVLAGDEMLVVGTHERSIDSRYTGPVKINLINFRVWPLWTRE